MAQNEKEYKSKTVNVKCLLFAGNNNTYYITTKLKNYLFDLTVESIRPGESILPVISFYSTYLGMLG